MSDEEPQLAYCARSLAAPDPRVRDIAREWRLALELADDGALDTAFWRAAGIPIATVQAWWLHEAHPIHPDPEERDRAATRMLRTIEAAEQVGAPRVLAVCGFGDDVADRPYDRCVEYFAGFAERLRDAGLLLLLEPLSPRRCRVLWNPAEIVRMAAELDAPDVVRLCLDTGHLVDSGFDLDEFFAKFGVPVEEIQLKGPLSAPPAPDLPLGRWIEALPQAPSVLSAEHNVPLEPGSLGRLVEGIRAQIRA